MLRLKIPALLAIACLASANAADLAEPARQQPQAQETGRISVSVLPTGPKNAQVITVTRAGKDKSEQLLCALLDEVLTDRKMDFNGNLKGRIVDVPGLGELGVAMWGHMPSGFKFPDGRECTVYEDCHISLPKEIREAHPDWAWRKITLRECKAEWKKENPDATEAEWRKSDAKFGGHNFDALSVRLNLIRNNAVGAAGSNRAWFLFISKKNWKAKAGTAKLDGADDDKDDDSTDNGSGKSAAPSTPKETPKKI